MAITDISHSQTQEAVIHHAANAAAVAIPVGSVVFHLPEWVAVTAGILGIIWYLILIGEKITGWVMAHKRHEVPEDPRDLVEGSHAERPPSAH